MATTATAPVENHQLWVDKYKPKERNQIIGNRQHVQFIEYWLNHYGEKGIARALLVGGPPGIGKSSTVRLLGDLAGFSCVEINASDVRNKAGLQETVKQVSNNRSVMSYFRPAAAPATSVAIATTTKPTLSVAEILAQKKLKKASNATMTSFTQQQQAQQRNALQTEKKSLMIVDEVDGIHGQSDRGGVAELIAIIKATTQPIVCICNDLFHAKLKALKTHCQVLEWKPPTSDMIVPTLMRISQLEKCGFSKDQLEIIVTQSNSDIRQCINAMQFQSKAKPTANIGKSSTAAATTTANTISLDINLNVFQIIRQMLSAVPSSKKIQNRYIDEISHLFFQDPFILSCFLFENYLKLKPTVETNNSGGNSNIHNGSHHNKELNHLLTIEQCANAMSDGDMLERFINNRQDHDLMPAHAALAAAIPCFLYHGQPEHIQLDFPGRSMGHGSSINKTKNLLLGLRESLLPYISTIAELQDRLPLLHHHLTAPMTASSATAIEECVKLLQECGLDRQDWQTVQDLVAGLNPQSEIKLETKVKTAFTRKFNSTSHKVHVVKKKQKLTGKSTNHHAGGDLDGNKEEDEEINSDIEVELSENDENEGVLLIEQVETKQTKATKLKTDEAKPTNTTAKTKPKAKATTAAKPAKTAITKTTKKSKASN